MILHNPIDAETLRQARAGSIVALREIHQILLALVSAHLDAYAITIPPIAWMRMMRGPDQSDVDMLRRPEAIIMHLNRLSRAHACHD